MLLNLFLTFAKIGLLSIGGGYAAIPIIQSEIVLINKWISMVEFTDLITISYMTPGPISLNAATFVGTKLSGISGAIIATIGCIAPSVFLVLIVAKLYEKYSDLPLMKYILLNLRPTVVALIAGAGLTIIFSSLKSSGFLMYEGINMFSVFLFVLSLILLRKFKMDSILVMVLIACVGLGVGMFL